MAKSFLLAYFFPQFAFVSLGWKLTNTVYLLEPILFSLKPVNETHFLGSLSATPYMSSAPKTFAVLIHTILLEPSALSLAHRQIAHLDSVFMRGCKDGQQAACQRSAGLQSFFL